MTVIAVRAEEMLSDQPELAAAVEPLNDRYLHRE
jgi:hypothetical protein